MSLWHHYSGGVQPSYLGRKWQLQEFSLRWFPKAVDLMWLLLCAPRWAQRWLAAPAQVLPSPWALALSHRVLEVSEISLEVQPSKPALPYVSIYSQSTFTLSKQASGLEGVNPM